MNERSGPLDTTEEHVEQEEHNDEHSSQGTFVILLIYLVIIIGIWGSVYLILLQRG